LTFPLFTKENKHNSLGTGKSFLTRIIIDRLRKLHGEDAVAVTAPTGIAAYNISGQTIHSFAGFGTGQGDVQSLINRINGYSVARERWKKTKVLIIDETSMLHRDLFDKIDVIAKSIRGNLQPFGGLQVILVGDFYQLPPVSENEYDPSDVYAFNAAAWDNTIDRTFNLTQVFRQKDERFIEMLNNMRIGELTQENINMIRKLDRPLNIPNGLTPVMLFSKRDEARRENARRLAALPDNKMHTYEASDWGITDQNKKDLDKKCMYPTTLSLKIGAQVVLLKNISKELVNGLTGIIKEFRVNMDEEVYPVIKFSNGIECVIGREKWTQENSSGKVIAEREQVPLLLAWAMTIHKCQGLTLDWVEVDLKSVFAYGQAYVAFSRARSLDGLRIMNFDPRKCIASGKVKNLYKKLSYGD